MKISEIFCILIILLFQSACLQRKLVNVDSEKISKADFVELTLKSGEIYVLTETSVHPQYLEGKHRDKLIKIYTEQIASVEVVNHDYRKALLYYTTGSVVMLLIALWLVRQVPTN
jgi:ribosomal protein L19